MGKEKSGLHEGTDRTRDYRREWFKTHLLLNYITLKTQKQKECVMMEKVNSSSETMEFGILYASHAKKYNRLAKKMEKANISIGELNDVIESIRAIDKYLIINRKVTA